MSKTDSPKGSPHSGHRERMRERFDADSEMLSFHEHEMLEFLLNTVIPRKDTNEIAHQLIRQNGSLYGVFNASVQDLLSVKNMTVNAAYLLTSIIPIVRKSLRMSNEKDVKKIISYGNAADFFHTFFMARNTECVCVMYLGLKYKLLKTTVVNDLNPASVTFNVRNIAAAAIKCGARYIIVGHNHPSGSAMPSEDDFMLIWHLFNVLAGLDIDLLDNFIFTENGFLSFRNVGILNKFLVEYNYRNPARMLKEDNKRVSLYVTNLHEYLINVTQLKQEKLVELITVDEFIKKNRPKINDVRAEKSEFVKEDLSRRNSSDKASVLTLDGDDGKLIMDFDNTELEIIADQLEHGDMGEYNRNTLQKVDVGDLYNSDKIEVIDNKKTAASEKKRNKAQCENTSDKKPRKIIASSRNIPEFIEIPDRNGGGK